MPCHTAAIGDNGIIRTGSALTQIPPGVKAIQVCPKGGEETTITCSNRTFIGLTKCDKEREAEDGMVTVKRKLLYTLYAMSGAFVVFFLLAIAVYSVSSAVKTAREISE